MREALAVLPLGSVSLVDDGVVDDVRDEILDWDSAVAALAAGERKLTIPSLIISRMREIK